MKLRKLPIFVAAGALIAAPIAANAQESFARTSAPVAGESELGGGGGIGAAAIIVALAAVGMVFLIVDDDDDDAPVSP